ncbi:MAG: hypothetical protein FD123_2852 [Bacteroidetes bacterium]|nr:MAG: hypothetical protein FD123_2852 [Bacteroidota bacterium]
MPSRLFVLLALVSVSVRAQTVPDSTSDPLINYVISLSEQVEREQRFTDFFSPDSISSLPVGIAKEIGGTRYIIAIDSAFFTPAGAFFNAYMALQFPNSDKKIAFAAKHVRFNPRGVTGGNLARLMLVSEHSLDIGPHVKLKLKPDGQNFIDWDCSGFQGASIKGYFEFSKGKLLPDSTQTTDRAVTASFQLYTNDIHDFITQVNITPFCITGLRDWSFRVTNATVDMSELANAPGMFFPVGYPNSLPVWTGFYLRDLTVKLPPELARNGQRSSIQASHLLIDNMGVSGLFQATNVFSLGEGSMSGWDFSLDEIGVSLQCNALNGGHLGGKIHVPVMDSAQNLIYDADLFYNPQNHEADYSIIVAAQQNVHLDVFAANVDIYPTTQVTVLKQNGVFKPKAVFNGMITVDAGKFKTAKLGFQRVTLITARPYIIDGVFSFTNNASNDTTKAANFPLTFNSIQLALDPQGHPRIAADVMLKFTDDNTGFTAVTRVEVIGKLEEQTVSITGDVPQTVTKTKWKYDRLRINAIYLSVQTQPFVMRGTVMFRENDPVYGDGFFGNIRFIIPKAMNDTAQLTACFGRTAFRYWYVDAYVPTNIQLGTAPVTLTRIMGGMYYHMSPARNSPAAAISAVNASAVPPLNQPSQVYVPDENTGIGFKAGTAFRYTPSEKAFNGDVLLEVAFNSNGGLSFIRLDGNVYMLTDRTNRLQPNAVIPVRGSTYILYDADNHIFDANLSVLVNVQNTVTGNANAHVYISPQYWFACVGRPTAPATISIANLASAQSYVMIGSQLEPMAAPPAEVAWLVSQNGLNNQRNQTQLSSGSGFCAGVRINSGFYKEFGWDFFSVYGGFNFGTGFDMMLVNYGPNAHCTTGERAGFNGWQAQGQLYIYLQGSVGVYGRFAGDDFNIQIMQANIAAIVGGKAPRPTYLYGAIGCQYNILGGLVNGSFNFDYVFGQDCSVVN